MLEKTRSRSKLKKPKTKDKRHLNKVRALGCIICGSPASAHHIRHGMGLSQKSSDYETIPLCHYHHQGAEGIHTLGTKVWQKKHKTEIELLQKVQGLLK